MKSPILLFAAILAWLFPRAVTADEALTAAAVANREAAVVFSIDLSPDTQGYYYGAFVSEDGLAFVNLTGLCGKQKPRVATADGKPLKLGTILGMFPEQDIALMKFAHRPKSWLRLTAKEPETGENLALVTINPRHPLEGKVPSIEGTVMAKRSAPVQGMREAAFMRVLSLGAGMNDVQRPFVSMGSFAVNAKGELAAFLFNEEPAKMQTFIYLAPAVLLTDKMNQFAKGGAEIPYPIPEASNPRDLAPLDPEWRRMVSALLAKDGTAARAIHKLLLKRYPGSRHLRTFSHPLLRGDRPIEEVPLPDAEASAPEKAIVFMLRAQAHLMKDDLKGAIPDLKAAIAVSPNDLPWFREKLADTYVKLGKLDEAEALYREALALAPESIALNESLADLLDERGKSEEAIKLTDRVIELERIYRRP